jgi:zinc and cadmium transporter
MVWAFVAALGTSLAALIGSGAILLAGKQAERFAVWLLAFAIGTLGGAAMLHLVPEALDRRPTEEVMLLFLGGIVLFIVMERSVRWRHTHLHPSDHASDHARDRAVTAEVLLWGDALHNFIDGVVLGIAFRASPELGWITALAVFAHEVPQEIGDFAVLLATGMKKRRAILLNYASAATIIPGAIVASVSLGDVAGSVAWLLPVAAGGFIYIALADLVPTLHHTRGRGAALAQIALIIAGIAVIQLVGTIE